MLCSCDCLKMGEGQQNQYKHGKLNGSCHHAKFQSTHQNWMWENTNNTLLYSFTLLHSSTLLCLKKNKKIKAEKNMKNRKRNKHFVSHYDNMNIQDSICRCVFNSIQFWCFCQFFSFLFFSWLDSSLLRLT